MGIVTRGHWTILLRALALANAYEQATDWHKKRPALSPDMPVPPVVRKT